MKKLVCKDKEICTVYFADNFKDRLLGYMFRKKPHYEAILFKPCSSIHTFFMRFKLDVLFLDKDMVVIKKIERLQNGKIAYEKKGYYVIEAEEGRFSDIEVGDRLKIEDFFKKS
ncbi:DUF192 domain-containing protein [Thermobrachium celere]|uniref:DUF192 domain-containing protein n=1 Tax=Thermobrachium celere DSM 8682 TaxID=941824 RepID=R7RTX1_9CLOT|nr:DUF192 domain-containing protein [Thermobrachium celere]CDF58753.1 hypothetical protein TCEL_00972 [Thermobrachium celere DSM 8682]